MIHTVIALMILAALMAAALTLSDLTVALG
jgi:hypothetical protein